ncbi:hypothetical protein M0R45_030737 [Rubus argutus]|uniref:MHC class I antigen n=1 Tax=Rubus argutus TaxID=59490 RepID=A0AAW1WE33_RUBAR
MARSDGGIWGRRLSAASVDQSASTWGREQRRDSDVRDDLGRAWRKGSTALWSESLVERLEAEEDGDGVRWQGG